MKKILLIRFSSFGDVILLRPVIDKLHKAGYSVDLATKKRYKEIFQHDPCLHQILYLEDFKSLFRLISRIRMNQYDKILDLHSNLRTFFIRLFLPFKVITYKKYRFRRSLFMRLKINLLKGNSVIRNYLNVLKKLHIPVQAKDGAYRIRIDAKAVSKSIVVQAGSRGLVTLAPFAKYFTKEWCSYNELIKVLRKKYRVCIIGEKKDFSRASGFPGILNLCGRASFHDMAYLISKSRLFICNDSGLMHLGAGTPAPMIVLLGSTVKEFGFMPLRPKVSILEKKDLACRPCHYHGRNSCPRKHFRCMKDISLEEVLHESKKYIDPD
ncbi:MAG: glycosyltransferase family 9 protein [bacterium]|nr:glycosyltransferase family 9 protein [bacterium]